MSLDVLPFLVPVVEQIAQRAVGFLVAGIDAGQAQDVRHVTAYVEGLFHFLKNDLSL